MNSTRASCSRAQRIAWYSGLYVRERIDERAHRQRVGVGQDGDRRPRALPRDVGNQVVGVVQPLDQHDLRPDAIRGTRGAARPPSATDAARRRRCSLPAHAFVLRAGGEQRPPLGPALLQHVRQVLLPDAAVLLLVLDDRALQPGGQVVGRHFAGAEVAGQGHAVGQDRDRLGRGEHAGRGLELVLAVERLAGPQFAEDGDDLFDRLVGRAPRPATPG